MLVGLGVSASKYCRLGLDGLLGGASLEHPRGKASEPLFSQSWTCDAVVKL